MKLLKRSTSLKGYLVLVGREVILALNFGPTISGKQWNFDWISRAHVFSTKKQALEIVRKHFGPPGRHDYRIVPVKEVCVLVPNPLASGKIVYRPIYKDHVRPVKEQIDLFTKRAHENESSASRYLKYAKTNLRMAKALEKFL